MVIERIPPLVGAVRTGLVLALVAFASACGGGAPTVENPVTSAPPVVD